MVGFSWNQWLDVLNRIPLSKSSRRPRRASFGPVEALEYRMVLTAPVANPASISTAVNTPVSGTLTGFDADGDPLIFHTVTSGDHGGLSLNSFNGEYTYTPSDGFEGTDSFTFIVNDGTSDSPPATVTITVGSGQSNGAPVANAANLSTSINTTLNGTLTGSDPDGDPLAFSVVSTAAHGSLTVNTNGSFNYVPDNGFTGSDSFTFKVNDGTVDSAVATASITVGSGQSNTAPVANSASRTTAMNTAINANLTGFDADGDPLTFSIVTTAAHGAATVNPNGTFSYVPVAGFTGNDSFTFKVNDRTVDSIAATVNINVTSQANSAPVANAKTINTGVNSTFNGTLTGTDADGDTLTFAAGSLAAAHGTATINPNGSFSYIPNSGYSGDDSFTFHVNDGILNSADATVTVHVGTANSAPVANPKTVNTTTNTAINGTLTGTDSNGDPLTFAVASVTPQHGIVTVNQNGTFDYSPTNNFTGDDFFTFTVNDGTVSSSEALVTIHVGTAANTPPVANPQTINTSANTTVNGALTGSDADGDSLSYSAGTIAAAHGVATIGTNGSFTYVPNSNYTGDDLFSFRVNDGASNSSEALVIIHVTSSGSNTAPTVINSSASATAGVAFNGSLSPLGTDIDGDPLTYSVNSQPSHGTLALSPDGTFVYTPSVGFTGNDSFLFQANDGLLNSNIGTFTVSVTSTSNNFVLNLSENPGTISTSMKTVVPLDSTASLIDVDPSATFANAAINATITAGADSQDRIVITDGTSTTGGIDVRGKKILFNGSEVARLSGGRHGQALQVSFNSSATQASVTAVLQRIGVRTTKHASRDTRTVKITVSAGGNSSNASIDANVS